MKNTAKLVGRVIAIVAMVIAIIICNVPGMPVYDYLLPRQNAVLESISDTFKEVTGNWDVVTDDASLGWDDIKVVGVDVIGVDVRGI